MENPLINYITSNREHAKKVADAILKRGARFMRWTKQADGSVVFSCSLNDRTPSDALNPSDFRIASFIRHLKTPQELEALPAEYGVWRKEQIKAEKAWLKRVMA
jgi:hypothetical protein